MRSSFSKLAEILGHCWATTIPLHTWWGFTTTQRGFHIHGIHIYKVFEVFINLHMQWMGVWIHHHSVFTAGATRDLSIFCRNPGSPLSYKPYHYTSDKAFQPPKAKEDPTFMSYTYKMFDNLHMQWMSIWIHHHSIFTTRFGKLAEILGHSWVTTHAIKHMMRLYNHPKWIPQPCHTYARCLTISIRNGWVYGSIITSLLMQMHEMDVQSGLKWIPASTMTLWHHYHSSSEPQSPNLVATWPVKWNKGAPICSWDSIPMAQTLCICLIWMYELFHGKMSQVAQFSVTII